MEELFRAVIRKVVSIHHQGPTSTRNLHGDSEEGDVAREKLIGTSTNEKLNAEKWISEILWNIEKKFSSCDTVSNLLLKKQNSGHNSPERFEIKRYFIP